jgi:hypothetical protein
MSSEETLLAGRSSRIERVAARPWREALANVGERMRERLAFMTPAHRIVREAAVVRLASVGRPLSARDLADSTGLRESAVDALLDELHQRLFFLVRNQQRDVSWAFPVTVERTPHHLTFVSGERLWGA